MLTADLWYLMSELHGGYLVGSWSDALYIPAYLSFGAAACSPSFAAIARPVAPTEARHDTRRLVLLGVAALLTPAMLALQWLRGGELAIPIVVAGTAITFFLVIARMANLAESLDESREQLRFEVDHDHLTGLSNRAALMRQLRQMLADHEPGVLLFIDLDGFKQVNDQLGHAAGDELLRRIAAEVRSCVRSTDIVARLGGDEFVAVIRTDDEIASFNLANRMIERLDLAAGEQQRRVQVTASVGLTRWTAASRALDPGFLIDEADRAMYRAKQASGNQLVIFTAPGEPAP
jgi:diguanylate cyclase (GGDEF)-like protein